MKNHSRFNKAISVIISLSMMLSAVFVFQFPFFGTASAAEADEAREEHGSHKICVGADLCPDCAHEDEEWTEWTKTDELPQEAGNYYLADNVNLTENWEPADNTVLCLNGKTISRSETNGSVIMLNNGAAFTLCDCKGGGKITDGNVSSGPFGQWDGGGVCIWNGRFVMYSGKITGNRVILTDSNLNVTANGGGVGLCSGSFMMYGGEISGNEASNSGGGVVCYSDTTFCMYGGRITDNISGEYGGGVKGSEMTVGGKAVINGNFMRDTSRETTPSNVYVEKLICDPTLTDGAYISVFTKFSPPQEISLTISGQNDKDYSRFFHSDNEQYEIINDDDNTLKFAVSTGHKHAVCGESNCTEHELSDKIWEPWTETDKLPDAEGYYYLENNVELTEEQWCPPDGTFLCLNGKTITQKADNRRVINIGTGVHFTLCDCGTDGAITGGNNRGSEDRSFLHGAGVFCSGIFEMYGGKITENHTGLFGDTHHIDDGGGVDIATEDGKSRASFTMYGGEISNNVSYYGGGLYINKADFTMYGGKIIGNKAVNGCGINTTDNSVLVIENGEIAYNTGVENVSDTGSGGVRCSGQLIMRGGTIHHNSADIHGGVSMITGKFVMTGGSITDNSATKKGGFSCNGGVTIEIGGDVVIKDNEPGNLRLLGNNPIAITEPLTDGAYIGITTDPEPTAEKPRTITKPNSENYIRFFHSDNEQYEVINDDDNTLKLVVSTGHKHAVCGEKNCAEHELSDKIWEPWTETDKLPADEGYYYLENNVELTEAQWCPQNGTFLCLNGKTITQKAENERVINIEPGVSFTLCDCKGGGLITGGENGIHNSGNFDMYGGTISGNANGVYQNGNMTVSGGAVIKDNENGNVYLKDGQVIAVAGALTEGAHIGVTAEKAPAPGELVDITSECSADCSDYFYSDNDNFEIINGDNNVVKLAAAETHEHPICGDKDCTEHTGNSSWRPWTKINELPDAAGYYYLENNVVLADEWHPENGTFLCLNGKTITQPDKSKCAVRIYKDHALTLCDCTGGGLITGGENGVHNSGIFDMYSGTISGSANGVYQNGSMTVGGSSVIAENTNNVFLTKGSLIKIGIDLSSSAKIGVSSEVAPAEGAPVRITVSAGLRANFFSDNADYSIGVDEKAGTLILIKKPGGTTDPDNTSKPGDTSKPNTPSDTSDPDNTSEPNDTSEPGGTTDPGNTDEPTSPDDTSEPDDIYSNLYLIIKEVNEADIPNGDRASVQEYLGTLGGWTAGQYYDVNLYEITGDTRVKLTETSSPVYISAKIPEKLLKAGSEFAVIRVHNGAAELLPDLDNALSTFTVLSDRFSTYALIYHQEIGENGSSAPNYPNPWTGVGDVPITMTAFASAALVVAIPVKRWDIND